MGPGGWKRIVWFVALWVCSVAAVGIYASVLKSWIGGA
ncbi:DUF2474 family protein [Rhizobium sp. Root1220]